MAPASQIFDFLPEKRLRSFLRISCQLFVRLFAPILPYITEEIWSWAFSEGESVHRAAWPTVNEFSPIPSPPQTGVLETAIDVLTEIRGAKSQAQKNMKHGMLLVENKV